MSFDRQSQEIEVKKEVSIPFEQGNVFRLIDTDYFDVLELSQSLSSRAMSFD